MKTIRHIFSLMLLFVVVCGPMVVRAEVSRDSELVQMFAWWNSAMRQNDGLTAEGFRQHFTEDAYIWVNGKEIVRGIEPMLAHFKRIQANTEAVEIILPFEEEFRAGNRIFTHHKSVATVAGKQSHDMLMGVAVMRDDKIAEVRLLSIELPKKK